MAEPSSFEQRHYDASQGVYEALNHPNGDIGPGGIHEALLEAALYASTDEEDDK